MFAAALRRSTSAQSSLSGVPWALRRISLHSRTFHAIKASSAPPLRAFVFAEPGDPLQVVTARTFAPLPPPGPDEVQLRIKLAAINPSDINVLQGVYPAKPRPRTDLGTPKPVFIPGNEGVGEVIAVGSNVASLPGSEGISIGDRVVMGITQAGTWSSIMNIKAENVITVDKTVTDPQAATMSVSALTIYQLNQVAKFTTIRSIRLQPC